MRSKEKAHDYRYFSEPDLLPVHVSAAWREEVRRSLPELPDAKRARFVSRYGLSVEDADVLTDTPEVADYFEDVVEWGADPRLTASWMQRVSHLAETTAAHLSDVAHRYGIIAAERLSELIVLVGEGKITAAVGKKVLATMFESGRSAEDIVAAEGLGAQVSDATIEQAASEIIAKNPDNVAKFKSGNEGVFKFFVGQVMKATKGQANPQAVNDILRRLLA
jgi:aspartyl-tRNA(Asn)/glutamyl-tRNA(Gln) amidotransferase subunit B